MFGIGLTRPLEGVFANSPSRCRRALASEQAACSRSISRAAWTATPARSSSGGAAVRATHTITFIGAKPGHFTAQGRDLTGDCIVAPIGVDAARATVHRTQRAGAVRRAPAAARLRDQQGHLRHARRDRRRHRHVRRADSRRAHGALRRRGQGQRRVFRRWRPALRSAASRTDAASRRRLCRSTRWTRSSIGCGMGQSDRAKSVLPTCCALDVPKLLDADALNLIVERRRSSRPPSPRAAPQGDPCVLTPHPLEAARLLGIDVKERAARPASPRRAQLAARFASVVGAQRHGHGDRRAGRARRDQSDRQRRARDGRHRRRARRPDRRVARATAAALTKRRLRASICTGSPPTR